MHEQENSKELLNAWKNAYWLKVEKEQSSFQLLITFI